MQTRQKLTEFESTIAFVVGGGLTLVVLVFALAAATSGPTADVSRLNLFLLLGALLFVVGTLVWLFTSRPWLTHDDWSEPMYVGHDAHHADHAEDHADYAEHRADTPAETLGHAGAVEASELAAAMNIAPSTAAALEVIEAAAAAEQIDPHPIVEPEAPTESAYMGVESPAYAEVVEGRVPDVPAEAVPEVQPPAPDTKRLDNLTIIEGIGPKISAALVAAGVDTFAKLAAMQPAEIESIVRAAGVRMVGKAETWAHQAGLAAEGKFDELKAYQQTLTAGRGASDE